MKRGTSHRKKKPERTLKMSIKVTTPSDTDIRISRWFNAPRHLVYRAFSDETILKRWLSPPGFSMTECTADMRAGGVVRFAWKGDAGGGMSITTVMQEVVPDTRLVGVEKFHEAWYPGEAIVTQEFADDRGGTTLTVTIRYESKAARDGVLKTPMTDGLGSVYDQLENLLGNLK
jgi:uncharacterized protein YndB with AHSA1/START domain